MNHMLQWPIYIQISGYNQQLLGAYSLPTSMPGIVQSLTILQVLYFNINIDNMYLNSHMCIESPGS